MTQLLLRGGSTEFIPETSQTFAVTRLPLGVSIVAALVHGREAMRRKLGLTGMQGLWGLGGFFEFRGKYGKLGV